MQLLKTLLLFTVLLPLSTLAAEPAGDNKEGARLFEQRCGLCHRGTGPGVFMLERRLGAERSILESRKDVAAAYVKTIVRQGIGSMPRFSRGEITDKELALIADYLD